MSRLSRTGRSDLRSMAGQQHVCVQRVIRCSLTSLLPSRRPNCRRLTNCCGGQGEVSHGTRQCVELLNATFFLGTQQFTPNFVARDFRDKHSDSASQQCLQPARASEVRWRPIRIRRQSQRTSIQQDDAVYHVTSFNSSGNSLRSESRSASSAWIKKSPVAFCSATSDSSASIHDCSSPTGLMERLWFDAPLVLTRLTATPSACAPKPMALGFNKQTG